MVIDTSALIAILTQEPDAQQMALAIENDPIRIVSAASVLEAAIVLTARHGDEAGSALDLLLLKAAVDIVPVTAEHITVARQAYLRYGKGRHPAGLNFGDCFPYALAMASGQPLLFKGGDFGQTDVKVVPMP